MKESEGGSSALLNTCHLKEKSGVTYSMSLLALCGFCGRKDMVDLLLKEGAGNTKLLVTQNKGTQCKNRIVILTTNLSCSLQMSEPI